ncbi:MAG: hypothetical protein AAF491_00795, partial [Verrucomicrobiota bacterium]
KALAIPTAIFLLLKFLKPEDSFSPLNVGLITGAVVIALILTGGYCAHKAITGALKTEIDEAMSKLVEGLDDDKIKEKFSGLETRIKISNFIKFIVMVCAWAVPLFAVIAIWNDWFVTSP